MDLGQEIDTHKPLQAKVWNQYAIRQYLQSSGQNDESHIFPKRLTDQILAIPTRNLLGLYAVLTVVFALFVFYSVTFKHVITDTQQLDVFLKITFIPILLLVASVRIIERLQDMQLRQSNTIVVITQGLPLFPGSKPLPKHELAYLGSANYTLRLFTLPLI